MLTSVHRDEANVVHALVMDRHISWRLQDLNAVVVRLTYSWDWARETLRKRVDTDPGVDLSTPQPRFKVPARCLPLLGLRRQRRHFPIRRIHDQGRAPGQLFLFV